jgi:transcriptional regulator with XRE-family HTH domain
MILDADKLKKLREARGWSQEQLAAAAGISVRTVQRAERDGSASRETKLCLAAALDVPHSTLEKPEPEKPAPDVAGQSPEAPGPGVVEQVVALYEQRSGIIAASIAASTFVYDAVIHGVRAETWLRSVFIGACVFVLFRIFVRQARRFGPSFRRGS